MHLHLRATLRIRDAAFAPGETYRVHLPLPTPTMQQRDVKILTSVLTPSTSHAKARRSAPRFLRKRCTTTRPLWPSTATLGTAYMPMVDGEPFHRLPDAPPPTEADLQEHAPHIVFTPYLK